MIARIDKSEIKGRVSAPPSKSYTIRGLMCAALARGESEIIHPLSSDDTEAAINVLRQVGVRILEKGDLWRVGGGDFHAPDAELFCGESAATLRFMTAICAVIPGECRLVAGPSLARRPIKPLVEALQRLGVDCSSQGDAPPLTVRGGKFRGGVAELPGDISSQFVSALLFLAPLAEEGVKIRLTTLLESKPYVLMTLECLKKFGIDIKCSQALDEFEVDRQAYKPARYEVEGDWSSASYFLALGAVGGEVEIESLNLVSLQGDKMMLNFLRDMGAEVEIGHNSVVVRKSKLKAIHADLSQCIDLLPTMSVLAAAADGTSELVGIERARLKESNRVAAMREGLERMGVRVREEKDKLIITGSEPKGAVIDSKDDHRIAMAFSILGLLAGSTVVNGAECVNKTFPQFWDILKSIGGKIETSGR
ncbi:MAG TPA: 3-phosphoshikimate 1-carboxyvinyltransferase [Dehalococcoidia bacterium]|nr:3-phosphoshikimate 1-carboxyvinyltransferase [Dehalococcoidia bacterium]